MIMIIKKYLQMNKISVLNIPPGADMPLKKKLTNETISDLFSAFKAILMV